MKSTTVSAGRKRNPARSREAILDAAEKIFADDGYDGSSLTAIGHDAGVSAALTAYFFGDKAGLYEAVIQRLFEDRDRHLRPICDEAIAVVETPGTDPRQRLRSGLEILVSGYLRFLQQRPSFVRLMAREALDIPRRATAPRHSKAFQEGVEGFIAALAPRAGAAVDEGQLVITIVALCFFPLEHEATMLAGMGYKTWTDQFIADRTEHVVDVLMRVLRRD
ncbi:MAG: TetR/AcrR family transcriptional regulator [Solirubrobacteraceae bacterium]